MFPIDISSLYPSIMLRFGICSRKDPEHQFLGVMQYMTQERLRLKQLAKEGNIQAHHKQNALKILINGSYSFLGTGGYTFNDYEAELELSHCGMYVPKAKSYVIIHPNGKTTVKGIFRKRNRYPLERIFPVEFLKRYFLESEEAALAY